MVNSLSVEGCLGRRNARSLLWYKQIFGLKMVNFFHIIKLIVYHVMETLIVRNIVYILQTIVSKTKIIIHLYSHLHKL